MHRTPLCLSLALALGLSLAAQDVATEASRAPESAKLQSIGPIAFAEDHTILVSDPKGAAIFAFDLSDLAGKGLDKTTKIEGFGDKIAAMLGTKANDIRIIDVAVNPLTQQAYAAVMRGQGNRATPVLVSVSAGGKLDAVSFKGRKFSSARLDNAPAVRAANAAAGRGNFAGNRRGRRRGRGNQRMESITDIGWIRDKVVVAGLSNEEFASKLRVLDYPLKSADKGTSVEIYHGAHGKFETRSPIRTFIPYQIQGKQHIVAAYTCTPLVLFPVLDLSPGKKVKGKTIAELGNRNKPLDIIAYEDEGKDFLLIANSSRGIMKVSVAGMEDQASITSRVPQGETAGQGYETIKAIQGVVQLDKLGKRHALVLIDKGGALTLQAIPLP